MLPKAVTSPQDIKEEEMKYHGHEIKVVQTDLGEDDPRLNKTYEIRKGKKLINVALTLSTAKAYIDNGYDQRYL